MVFEIDWRLIEDASPENRRLDQILRRLEGLHGGGALAPSFALPRGFVAAVYDCRIGAPPGAHRDIATATARLRSRVYTLGSARRR